MQAWPMRFQTAQETGMTLNRNWFTVHVVLGRVRPYQGGNFKSMQLRELTALMGCEKTRTTQPIIMVLRKITDLYLRC